MRYALGLSLALLSAPSLAEPADTWEQTWEATKQATQGWVAETKKRVTDLTAETPPDPKQEFADLWRNVYPSLDELLALKDQHEDLPDSAWFGNDKVANQKKIAALLGEAVQLLGLSEVRTDLQAIKRLEEEIKAGQDTLSRLQTEKISYPQKAAAYTEEINATQGQINANKAAINKHQANIARYLQAAGMPLSQEQLDVLMSSVVGEDMVSMSVVFHNVQLISQQLSQLMRDNQENLDFARKHYGMYAILLEVMITMQDEFVREVMARYLPGVEKIEQEALQLQQHSQEVLNFETDPSRRASLQASIEAQQLSLRTLDLYRKRLKQQADQVLQARDILQKDLSVAMIRYQTVKISGELVKLIQTSNEQFNTLANLQLPELVPFENLAMKAEFEKLTEELRRAE